jgi:copper chaperone
MDANLRPIWMKERAMKSVTLKIEGMHCTGCAQTIRGLIEREPGVKTTTVSFEDGAARVLYDPAATDENRLVAAIEKPGFRVVDCDEHGKVGCS